MPMPRPTMDPSWLHILVVAALGAYLIIGAVAWVIFAYEGRDFPESLGTTIATIAGGLVGVLSAPAPGGRQPDQRDRQQQVDGDGSPS